ncbi:MAG: peptidase M28, partial [Phocaeicola sp.]
MRKHYLLLMLAAAFCVTNLFAQPAAVKKIIEMGETDNRVMHQIDVLTNRFGGRLIGSDAYENAAEWMLREYKKWGVTAYLEEAGEVPVGFNRGPWFGRMIGGDAPMQLHFVTPSYTSGTKGVQRGHVVMEPRSEAELKRIKHKLKGAWVLVGGLNSGWPISQLAPSDSLRQAMIAHNVAIQQKNDSLQHENRRNGGKHQLLPYRELPGLFYKEMVEAGALGFIQSSTVPLRALYDRKLVNNPETTF